MGTRIDPPQPAHYEDEKHVSQVESGCGHTVLEVFFYFFYTSARWWILADKRCNCSNFIVIRSGKLPLGLALAFSLGLGFFLKKKSQQKQTRKQKKILGFDRRCRGREAFFFQGRFGHNHAPDYLIGH